MYPMLPAVVAGGYATLGVALLQMILYVLLLGPSLAWASGFRLGLMARAVGATVLPATILILSHLDVFGISYLTIWGFLSGNDDPGNTYDWLGFAYLMLCAFVFVIAMGDGIVRQNEVRLSLCAGDKRAEQLCRRKYDSVVINFVFSFLFGFLFVVIPSLRDFVIMLAEHAWLGVSFFVNGVSWLTEYMHHAIIHGLGDILAMVSLGLEALRRRLVVFFP